MLMIYIYGVIYHYELDMIACISKQIWLCLYIIFNILLLNDKQLWTNN